MPTSLAQTPTSHPFNGIYRGENLRRIAFPIGGIGAGMFCLEGTGALSHFSVRNRPDIYNEPSMFAAICIKGMPGGARVLEGPVPDWKKFGQYYSAMGSPGATWGLPRFREAAFMARFPFAEVTLQDKTLPLAVTITGWSPFIPGDADNSSLPAGGLEYRFTNTGKTNMEYVFSYNARNFMAMRGASSHINPLRGGFVLGQDGNAESSDLQGDFAIYTDDTATVVNHCWFRGGWFDPLTMTWNTIEKGVVEAMAVQKNARGASLMVPFQLKPGQSKTIRLMMAWYVPHTKLRLGNELKDKKDSTVPDASVNLPSRYHMPWYSSRFKNIEEVAAYWRAQYEPLRQHSVLFRDAFYNNTLPPEVTEAVAANLTILKSPTVLRQYDGRLWAWEGSADSEGSCHGSCTHVWNYAQALNHLFPGLERSLRETEFGESQDSAGHQEFRSALPIRPQGHKFYAASDGQLGGIMKTYRDWRVCGDSVWLRRLYPRVKNSLDYCIRTWDPRQTGTLQEPHHNTYDIEFWGADPMCTSFYLGALEAMTKMGNYLGEDVRSYRALLAKGKQAVEHDLYNGEYFFQQIQWTGLSAPSPMQPDKVSTTEYSEEGLQLLQKEGPKYQYGTGCLSDGMLGAWLAGVCGLPATLDTQKVKSHLLSVYKYNFKKDLSLYSNPERPTFAVGEEGGLLLCSWPRGGRLSLPFVYSAEVWTGIEYQVASHLISLGHVKEGLEIVRACRSRYDGRIRNPFDEYECGHWYARAMSSYALLESLTGVRYDAVEKTLYVQSRVGNFTSFLCTTTGFGNVVYYNGRVTVKTVYGHIDVQKTVIGQ